MACADGSLFLVACVFFIGVTIMWKGVWYMRGEETRDQFTVPKKIRGICYMMALLMFSYALIEGDVPLGLLAFSLVAGLVSSSFTVRGAGFARELQKMMYGFSFTLFIGAMFMLFFY